MFDGIEISVCYYPGKKEFDVMLRCPSSGEEVTLSGAQELTDDQVEFLCEKAPPCVWTRYAMPNSPFSEQSA